MVTAGFRSTSLESYFPANIPIGVVAPVNENQLFNDGQIQVTPAANLRRFDVVQILTARSRAPSGRRCRERASGTRSSSRCA